MPEDNGKQNPAESYANKHQKHVTCSYGFILYLSYNFSKYFKIIFRWDSVYNFINSMIKEGKYSTDIMKNILTKTF